LAGFSEITGDKAEADNAGEVVLLLADPSCALFQADISTIPSG
jgi:hypothetical protein